MVFAEDIRKTILKIAEERGPEESFYPSDVARRVDRDNWEMHLDQVQFVASVLIKEGKINATLEKQDTLRSNGQLKLKKKKLS
jgi:hypothetical protein